MIKHLIRKGESQTLDFKQTISSARKIAITLVAFANTKGGKILVGVKDNGSIVGAKTKEDKYMLEGAAELNCKPPVKLSFEEVMYEGKPVLVANVLESMNKPHYAKGDDSKWWAYIRSNDQCLLASTVMLDVMKKDSKGFSSEITFGIPEKLLLQHLENNSKVTLKEFQLIANIPKWKANRIIVNMVRMKIIKVLSSEKAEHYAI